MPFIKVLKTKQYFKRYQTAYRRRREGKTDYGARRKLLLQDKNKYASPKYRLVVRFTNRAVICQVAYAEIVGDKILCQANSRELKRYGLNFGLKNYAAAYCTGLLLARRLLTKLGLAEAYEGVEEATGEMVKTEDNGRTYFVDELDDDRRPFRALLDVGIVSTTTGARVFGALKGAVDGGLDVPHNFKRFPGYDKDRKKYIADDHRDRIMGAHVAEYIEQTVENDEEAQTDMASRLFPKYVENECTDSEALEELYTKVHEAIRADPSGTKSTFTPDKEVGKKAKKLTYEERKAALAERKAEYEAEGDYEEGEEEGEEGADY